MRRYPAWILPAVVFSLVAFILLLLVTISTPLWNAIYFLKLITGPNEPDPLPSNATVTFGVFGSTNGTQRVGWVPANWSGTGLRDPTVDQRLNSATYALVLHPVAAFLSVVTFGFSMIGLCSRAGAVFATFSSGLLAVTTIVVFIVDAILFSTLKSDFVQPPYDNRRTSYGPALWMSLTALIASLITFGSAAYTGFSHNRYPRKWVTEKQY